MSIGSPTNEVGRNTAREGQRSVRITKPFYLGVFEVTQRQWELISGKRPSHFGNSDDYAMRPVESFQYSDIRGGLADTPFVNWPITGHAVAAGSFMGLLRAKTGIELLDLPTEAQWEGAQPSLAWGWMRPEGKKLLTQWRTTPVAVDWNKDGLVDLVMLDHEGYLAFFERAEQGDGRILKHPRRIFRDTKGAPLQFNKGRAGRSGRRKLCVVDWDGDGRLDLLLNSRNAEFWRQVRAEDGRYYFENKGHLHDRNVEGHDVSPTFVDFNNDGIPDFVGGAEDGHLYYLRNPRTP